MEKLTTLSNEAFNLAKLEAVNKEFIRKEISLS